MAVQLGTLWPAAQSLMLDTSSDAVPTEVYPESPVRVPGESFAVVFSSTCWANAAVPVSVTARAAGGGRTTGEIVAEPYWPMLSATTYRTGPAVPLKIVPDGHAAAPAAVHGTNVTVPSAFTVYLPLFESVRVVNVQLLPVYGAVAWEEQSRTEEISSELYCDAVSLPRMLMFCVWFCSS